MPPSQSSAASQLSPTAFLGGVGGAHGPRAEKRFPGQPLEASKVAPSQPQYGARSMVQARSMGAQIPWPGAQPSPSQIPLLHSSPASHDSPIAFLVGGGGVGGAGGGDDPQAVIAKTTMSTVLRRRMARFEHTDQHFVSVTHALGMRCWAFLFLGACVSAARPTDTLLIANKQDATLQLVDVATRATLATLPTGVGPHEVSVSPDGTRAVVSNYGDKERPGSTLTVVDLVSRKVTRTIDLGEHRRPHGSAFLPDGRRLLVTVEVNEGVLVVDVEAAKVLQKISTAQKGTHMVSLGPGARRAYTANIFSGTVSALDVVSGTSLTNGPAGAHCEGIAASPNGAEVWIGSNQEDVVRVLDAATLAEVAKLPAMGVPIRLAFTPDGARVLVANAVGSKLQVVDARRRELVGTVAFPPPSGEESAVPVGTLVDPEGRRAYVALVARGEVAIVDLTSLRVVGTISAGKGPDGMGYSRR